MCGCEFLSLPVCVYVLCCVRVCVDVRVGARVMCVGVHVCYVYACMFIMYTCVVFMCMCIRAFV